MSVLVYVSTEGGELGRLDKEVLNLGRKLSSELGSDCVAICLSGIPENLSKFGATKIVKVSSIEHFDASQQVATLTEAFARYGSTHVLLPHNARGKALAGLLAVKLGAEVTSDVIAVRDSVSSFTRSSHSGKSLTHVSFESGPLVLTVSGDGTISEFDDLSLQIEEIESSSSSRVELRESIKQDADISLEEADIVVSGGRGLKSGENWEIIEELARELGAATACSRPVADSEWRPHHEHVGQTGLSIKPGLYIAVGISGAIQHLAGVNSSKTIVVVNSDPEAPFFKAADYGVCGDLFEVIPKLTAAVKASK